MKRPEEYKLSISGISFRDVHDGVPNDACVKFCKSYATRMRNIKMGKDNGSDKAIIEQRIANIAKVHSLYRSMQRQILGDDWRPDYDFSPERL